MKKITSLRAYVCLFVLLAGIGLFCTQAANAQAPQQVVPVPLYRFFVPSSRFGFFLTPNYQEGINRGYTNPVVIGNIVLPPGPGWTPAPNQGLAPMYRWRVAHKAGTNFYYSAGIYPSITSNSQNTLEGLMGYGLLPSTQWGGTQALVLHLWYSDSNGYYYSTNGSMTIPPAPPNSTYNWQGVAYRLPPGASIPTVCGVTALCYIFNPPTTTTTPTCNADQEQACYTNGGTWSSATCSCLYPPPTDEPTPTPCRTGMICAPQPLE